MEKTLAIVGLGYVGLPLAYSFAKKGHRVLGYDVSSERIEELKAGNDRTNELTTEQLQSVEIELSSDPAVLKDADIVIVALPTPIDDAKKPDLTILKAGSKTVGQHLKKGAIVVYESTVYPGTTEEICGPILEEESGLACGRDFFLGYSPERINPGDKEHTVEKIIKVVSGQDDATTDTLCALYASIVEAGVHRAPNIKTAEMAKAIENAQRDLNIAFVNEIALLCDRVGIATTDVLDAAGTKWNFLRFQPGLVGGHCIGVDPYYLVEKAKQLDMDTHVIAAGRAVNDAMAAEVAEQIIAALPGDCREPEILVLGLTFKENIPDTRNSKAPDVARALSEKGCSVAVHDPFVSKEHIEKLGLTPGEFSEASYDAVALLVPHDEYVNHVDVLFRALRSGGLLYDLKSIVDRDDVEGNGLKYAAL